MSRTPKQIARSRLPDDPKVLQDTIALMESRLRRLGDGDCGYEKAMIRFYEQQLVLYRARLRLLPVMCDTPVGSMLQRLSGTA